MPDYVDVGVASPTVAKQDTGRRGVQERTFAQALSQGCITMDGCYTVTYHNLWRGE